MDYGISMPITEYSTRPWALAQAVEERDFESLFVPEHSHIPNCRTSPWSGGAVLPKVYYEMMDPFVALAAAAAVTQRIKLGTGVCLVVQRDPIQLAKEVASLDKLSGGRFVFGIGGGWNAEEMADHGTDYKTRFKLLRERVAAMKTIWTEDDASYSGEFVSFSSMGAWPKPAQVPHPPILLGGAYPHAAKRAIAYGNGWIPLAGRGEDLAEQMEGFHAMAVEAGRDPAQLPVTAFLAPSKPEALARLRDSGIARAVFMLPPQESADEQHQRLDRLAELVAKVG